MLIAAITLRARITLHAPRMTGMSAAIRVRKTSSRRMRMSGKANGDMGRGRGVELVPEDRADAVGIRAGDIEAARLDTLRGLGHGEDNGEGEQYHPNGEHHPPTAHHRRAKPGKRITHRSSPSL